MLLANTSWYLYNFRTRLVQTLQAQGHHVVAVAPKDAHTFLLEEVANQYKTWELTGSSKNPWYEFKSIWHLYQRIREHRPDVICSYTPKANIYAALVCKFTKTRMICNVSGLGNVFIEGGITKQLVKYLYKFAFSKVDKVFFQNKDDQQLFLGMGLVSPDVVGLLPGSGVDVDYFSPAFNRLDSGQPFTFIFIARMLKEKGLFEYLSAAQQIKQQSPEVRFLLLGPIVTTNPTAVSKQEIMQWQEKGVVEYLGETDEVRDFLAKADCVVLPSYREGMPRSLLEAASMAKPVITTDTPGCRDVVEDGVTGYVCALKSSQDLALAMQKMLGLSVDARKRMGKKARAKMLSEFDEQIVLDAYLKEISRLQGHV